MTKETISDVWSLESIYQASGSDLINYVYRLATEQKSTKAKNELKKLFGNSWQVIKERMNAEGSMRNRKSDNF